jgi:branched-chain amino acid transport system substrate-binding protein
MALADYGPIKGHDVEMGAGLDSLCTEEGGRAAADTVTGDPRVVGVIGTSCSVAATAASPILSEAGLVMISSSNTAPSLTSDLRGKAGSNYHPGYYRTANNDLYEANAVADFAYHELGLRKVVTLDDGDPYTMGLTVAFGNAFRALGGEVPVAARIEKGEEGIMDIPDILEKFAAAEPDGIYFPLFSVEGAPFAEQAQETEGLEDATLLTSSALLLTEFLAMPQSEGIYFAGPEPAVGSNVNEATGKSVDDVLEAFSAAYGESPSTPYWVHSYDAGTLLFSAIESVGQVVDGKLYVDRAALREAIGATEGFEGLLGTLSCDDFGDCGTGAVNIYHHTDPEITDPAQLPVVFQFAP